MRCNAVSAPPNTCRRERRAVCLCRYEAFPTGDLGETLPRRVFYTSHLTPQSRKVIVFTTHIRPASRMCPSVVYIRRGSGCSPELGAWTIRSLPLVCPETRAETDGQGGWQGHDNDWSDLRPPAQTQNYTDGNLLYCSGYRRCRPDWNRDGRLARHAAVTRNQALQPADHAR